VLAPVSVRNDPVPAFVKEPPPASTPPYVLNKAL